MGVLLTPSKNSSLADALAPLAVTRTCSRPIWAWPGVPLKVRLAGSKLKQAGKAAPELKPAL